MVFASLDQPRDTYYLWKRFSFPTEHGSRDAIAFSTMVGDKLISAYALMVDAILLELWVIVILAAVFFSKRTISGQKSTLLAEVYAARDSIFSVFTLAMQRLWLKPRTRPLWLAGGWAIAALVGTVVQKSLSIVISPASDIGNGAPVAFDRIFLPDTSSDPRNETLIVAAFELQAPAIFRALGTAQVVDDLTSSRVTITQSTFIGNAPDNTPSVRIEYQYNITALEFGLQNYLDLTFNVEGSCYTEYGWYIGPKTDPATGKTVDVYYLWNNSSKTQSVSPSDAPEPRVYISYESNRRSPDGNSTFAMIPSTVGRKSHTIGTDPWYKTEDQALNNDFTVLPGRPVLSCWQSDLWYYHGKSNTTASIASLPGLKGLGDSHLDSLFTALLSKPKVPSTAVYLGASALRSASTALGRTFPANTSSIFSDMQRLVLVSYISTHNSLLDTTLYPSEKNGVQNGITSNDTGVADFIVYSSNITALSMRVLIIIPSLTVGLWLLALFLRYKTKDSTEDFEYFEAKETVGAHEQRKRGKADEESPDMKGDTKALTGLQTPDSSKVPSPQAYGVAAADGINGH